MANTYGDLITDALSEIRYARAGDVLAPDDMAFGLRALNRLIDGWNADKTQIWTANFSDFTLTPNHNPHTIGPAADFVVTKRPVEIENAELNLGSDTFVPLDLLDDYQYANLSVPNLSASLPTAIYYSPNYVPQVEQGACYFWPISSQALVVRLWMRIVLGSVLETDEVSLPQGYEDALMLTLAERLAAPFGQVLAQTTVRKATEARQKIRVNNSTLTRLTSDGPKGRKIGVSSFNWRSRTFNNT